MSANRHLGRIIVLQTLYEQALRQMCGDENVKIGEILERNISRYKKTLDDEEFVVKLTEGVEKDASKLDEQLQPIAPEWPLSQISRIDHIILRMGTYELNNSKDVPPKVVVNEAVELAKAFGGDNSSKFINGVLGTVIKQNEKPAKKSKKPKESK